VKVEFYKHNLGQEELDSVAALLRGVFLTTGPLTKSFEFGLADYLGGGYAIGVSSCTSALFLSLVGLGIGPGDEVITTPMTFVATANAIIEAGAKPVFVDVEKNTGNMDASLIKEAITPQTKAVIPVHLYGQMCDMRAIRSVAERYGLKIIEDAAHCLEGVRDGLRPGTLSDAACFSFYATKAITSGEGGAVFTHNEELAAGLRNLRSHGIDKDASLRYGAGYRHWDMVNFGYKANMCDVQAAFLIPQIKRIEDRLKMRAVAAETYRRAFSGMPGLELPDVLPDTTHAHHLFTAWVDPGKRDRYLEKLEEKGIGVAVNYRPVHLTSFYKRTFGYKEGMFPNAERIGKRTISLPLYPSITRDEINEVVEAMGRIL